MKQITENYVSYEVAKLLKEKGFDEPTMYFFSADGTKRKFQQAHYPEDIAQPTNQTALKWLREVHKCYTHICPFYPDMKYNEPPKWLAAVDYNGEGYPTLPKRFDSYEEAVEAVLLYVLKNLI